MQSDMLKSEASVGMFNVFIGYAREDSEIALRLYGDLRRAGVRPWIDQNNLLPGENWRLSIQRAIKEASHCIVLLSMHSLNKRGYVQKELSIALDMLSQMPQGEIYLIPVRIDESPVSDIRLQDIHWVNLFPNYTNGVARVLRAIRAQNPRDMVIPLAVASRNETPKSYVAEHNTLEENASAKLRRSQSFSASSESKSDTRPSVGFFGLTSLMIPFIVCAAMGTFFLEFSAGYVFITMAFAPLPLVHFGTEVYRKGLIFAAIFAIAIYIEASSGIFGRNMVANIALHPFPWFALLWSYCSRTSSRFLIPCLGTLAFILYLYNGGWSLAIWSKEEYSISTGINYLALWSCIYWLDRAQSVFLPMMKR